MKIAAAGPEGLWPGGVTSSQFQVSNFKFQTIGSRRKDRSIVNIQYSIVNYRGLIHGKMAK